MTEAEKARRLRASNNYRSKQAKDGQTQVQIWLPEDMRERLDEAVKARGYKNRSQALVEALSHMLEGTKM